MSRRNRNLVFSNFVCQECGNQIRLPRSRGKQREVGHIKDIYCIGCKTETKHDEIRYNDYQIRRDERID